MLYQRFKLELGERLHTNAFNATWHPSGIPLLEQKISEQTIYKTLPKKRLSLIVGVTILSCLALFFTARFSTDAPPLKVSRIQAINIARTALEQEGLSLEGFQAVAKIKPNLEKHAEKDLTHRYVWQSYPQSIYAQLTGSYLNPPHWVVRFLKFTGSLQERAESYEGTCRCKCKHNDARL